MLLTITNERADARDLGYLLHKHPDRVHPVEVTFGSAFVVFPEAQADRCTAALVVEVDPVGLVRGRRPGGEGLLDQYVNDRPFAASSLLSVALSSAFRSALAGRCKDKPELVDEPLPLVARVAAIPCRGGESILRRLFEPLGYVVDARRLPLDEAHPEWGEGVHHDVTLRATIPLRRLLAHLYVLIPVLDDEKHYWVGEAEIEKLLRHGEGWLEAHPARELITHRALRHERRLTREALAQLTSQDDDPDPDAAADDAQAGEALLEKPVRLDQARRDFVTALMRDEAATSCVDLGCGEGRLLRELLKIPSLERIAGLDVSLRALQRAERRIGLHEMSERQRARIQLLHGSLTYRDDRIAAFDAAVAVEVIEHLDPPRVAAFERVVFGEARPRLVVVTTPNAEYNALLEGMSPGAMRHADHRFEWTRAEFETWARATAERFGYAVGFAPIGPIDEELGAPTQAGVFRRG